LFLLIAGREEKYVVIMDRKYIIRERREFMEQPTPSAKLALLPKGKFLWNNRKR
jgi:hypothetical protein